MGHIAKPVTQTLKPAFSTYGSSSVLPLGDSDTEASSNSDILSLDTPLKLSAFTGNDEISFFTLGFQRFKDYAGVHTKPWTDSDKARNFKFFLSDLACEKYENFDDSVKASYAEMVRKLKDIFESPKMRNVARQSLLACR